MLLVRCPNCKHAQKTNPKKITTATKKCVYCGKTFKIYLPKESRIIRSE